MSIENVLWASASALLLLVFGYHHRRIERTEEGLSKLHVHIAEKYTPNEDLQQLAKALEELRKEMSNFRQEFHNARVEWARVLGGKA